MGTCRTVPGVTNDVRIDEPPATQPRRSKILIWAAAGVAVLLAVAGTAVALNLSGSVPDLTVSGTVTVTATTFTLGTNTCAGAGGYDDIRNGAQVVVTDATGKTLALGELADGRPDGAHSRGGPNVCRWTFTVDGVPAGETFYGIEVTHRGVVQYDAGRIQQPVALSLGG